MGANRSSFGKLERDRAKKAKAAVKRERRQSRSADGPDEAPVATAVTVRQELSPGELLKMVEKLHQEFEAKLISFEDYEERKAEILSQLPVD